MIRLALGPLITIFAQGFVVLMILGLLVLANPLLALNVGLLMGTTYGLVFMATSNRLKRIGSEKFAANQGRFIALNEAFSAPKEVKFGGLENVYLKRFAGPALVYSKHMATASIVGTLPRFALELIAFGGMLLVILYLMD